MHSSRHPSASVSHRPGDAVRFGMLSTFPPTECGIATFAAALTAGIIATGGTVDVVRCGSAEPIEDASVVAILDAPAPNVAGAVAALNRTHVVIVQHEYGIYGGKDGEAVLEVLERLTVPVIVIAHTVLACPTPNQRRVLERICARADAVVVMTETARRRLLADGTLDEGKVEVIPHGAVIPSVDARTDGAPHRRPRLLTWGLLGPGKGIEWAIDAVAQLVDLVPSPPHYVIAGATHPKVLAASGESYRDMLRRRVADQGVEDHVTFDSTYRDLASLHALIQTADVVILPYDSRDQVTSGVLVDAVAAGRPVVSTAFPHAVELLASGAGIVVPQCDPDALATALRSVLTDAGIAEAMAAEARRLAPDLTWTAVGARYAALGASLVAGHAPLAS